MRRELAPAVSSIVAVILAALTWQCRVTSSEPVSDSESHFLDFAPCLVDEDCGDGLSCRCGVCTLACGTSGTCGDPASGAVCEEDPDLLAGACATVTEPTCLKPCETDAVCRELSPVHVCGGGYCTTEPACDALVDAPGDTVVDLGSEGLLPGELIDPYLETHLRPGVEVRVPAGRYLWDGGGLPEDLGDSSLIGDGEVILDAGAHEWNAAFRSSGAFELRNITVAGVAGTTGQLRVTGTTRESVLVFRNFSLPDGSVDGDRSGIYVTRDHAGAVYFYDARVEGFADGGLVGYSPGQSDGGHGEVHVVGGLFRNNNIANIVVGSSGSSVSGAVSIQDAPAPADVGGAHNQRGLRVRQTATGEDILIADIDLVQTEGANGALVVEGDPGGGGVIRDVRISTEIDNPPLDVRNEDSAWEIVDIDITGGGTLQPPADLDIEDLCTGAECAAPRTTPRPGCR